MMKREQIINFYMEAMKEKTKLRKTEKSIFWEGVTWALGKVLE